MNAIQNFAFEENLVRIVDRDGEPWFVANDVCRCLDLANPRKAVADLDDDEKGVTAGDTLGGKQSLNIISEPGVYRLVFRSRKPEAERFKRWLAHDVLPQIRRAGYYVAPSNAPGEMEIITPSKDDGGTLLAAKVGLLRLIEKTMGPAAMLDYMPTLGLPKPDSPVDNEAIACLRHLLNYATPHGTIRDLLNRFFEGDRDVEMKLKDAGITPRGDGFVLKTRAGGVPQIFVGTPWRRAFEYLRRLPDTKPFDPQGNGRHMDGTYIPSRYLDLTA